MAFLNFADLLKQTSKRLTKKTQSVSKVSDFDELQSYLEVGEYQVNFAVDGQEKKDYTLTVYQDDKGVLRQALRSAENPKLTPQYLRKYDDKLHRFRLFYDVKKHVRPQVAFDLAAFAQNVKENVHQGSINIGIITDTHFKDTDSSDFYGWNGLRHLREFNSLQESGVLDFKVHLGDWIDGSDAGLVGENELTKMRDVFKMGHTPFFIIKGNHDENDKFDEHHDMKASFPENEFESIMWPAMYRQAALKWVSTRHGVAYIDFANLRLISVNTSDIPYLIDASGKKRYDTKLTLAIREDQVEELIEILANSSGKQIIVMSHGNPIDRHGNNALKYNGRSLHELLVAFNQRQKGKMHAKDVPVEFNLSNDFDFTKVKDAKVIAYFAGHRHKEDQFRINGIQYVIFNCSALMGPNYNLTTKYNQAWNRQMDLPTESSAYIANVDLASHQLKIFGYGAASTLRTFDLWQLNLVD